MSSVFTMAQLAVASDAFDRSQDGKEKQGMDSVIVAAFFDELEKMKTAGDLTTASRDKLKKKSFALPKQRRYPIHDLAHARNALARVSQFGSEAEKAQVRAKVHSKYPELAGKDKEANFDPVGEARGFAGLIKSVGAAKREAGVAKGAVKTLAHKPGITQPIPKLKAPMQAAANPAGNMSNTVAHGSRAVVKQAPTQAPGMRGGLRRSLAIGGAAGLGGVMAGNMMHHDQPQQQQRF